MSLCERPDEHQRPFGSVVAACGIYSDESTHLCTVAAEAVTAGHHWLAARQCESARAQVDHALQAALGVLEAQAACRYYYVCVENLTWSDAVDAVMQHLATEHVINADRQAARARNLLREVTMLRLMVDQAERELAAGASVCHA